MVLVKERPAAREEESNYLIPTDELMAYCPVCKTYETVWLTKGQLTPTRKFSQRNNAIYHDCGSMKPCRLYRTF